MRSKILIVFGVSAVFFLLTLVTGPPSFDATDGAEFAVCGSELQIAHAPGYPLFLMIIRVFSIALSPLYGHLRMLNSFLGAVATMLGYTAFRRLNISFLPALAGTVLFIASASVLSQFNSLEVYPLAIVLVMSALPAGSIYRPVAHDTFYAAYAQRIPGFRKDILLSAPYGNYFEFSPLGLVPPLISDRTVHISRARNRTEDFTLQGLIFNPSQQLIPRAPNFNGMAVFRFQGRSPDPMAMDIIAEAWMRRMIQESDPVLSDSFYTKALVFAATKLTRRRIETIREVY